MDVCAPHACFSKVSRACPKFLTRDIRLNDPRCPWDIRPKNSLFGLLFVPEQGVATFAWPMSHQPQSPTLYWQKIVALGRPSTRSVMSHLYDHTVADLAVQRDNALATKRKYRFNTPPPFCYPPFRPAVCQTGVRESD